MNSTAAADSLSEQPTDLRSASLALLAQVAQSKELKALLNFASNLQARNDEADRWGTQDTVAVEAVMSHLRLALEAAERGQGLRR